MAKKHLTRSAIRANSTPKSPSASKIASKVTQKRKSTSKVNRSTRKKSHKNHHNKLLKNAPKFAPQKPIKSSFHHTSSHFIPPPLPAHASLSAVTPQSRYDSKTQAIISVKPNVSFRSEAAYERRIAVLDALLQEGEKRCDDELGRCETLVEQYVDFLYETVVREEARSERRSEVLKRRIREKEEKEAAKKKDALAKGADYAIPDDDDEDLMDISELITDPNYDLDLNNPDPTLPQIPAEPSTLTLTQKRRLINAQFKKQAEERKAEMRETVEKAQQEYRNMMEFQRKMKRAKPKEDSIDGRHLTVIAEGNSWARALNAPELLAHVLSFLPLPSLSSLLLTSSQLYYFTTLTAPVSLVYPRFSSKPEWVKFAKQWRHLSALELNNVAWSKTLLKNVHSLVSLSKEHCDLNITWTYRQGTVSMSDLMHSLANFATLTTFSTQVAFLNHLQTLPQDEKAPTKCFASLKELTIYFDHIHGESASMLTEDCIKNLFSSAHQLKTLHLVQENGSHSNGLADSSAEIETFIENLIKHVPQIVELRCDFISDTLWNIILSKHKGTLRRLELCSHEPTILNTHETEPLNLDALYLTTTVRFNGPKESVRVKNLLLAEPFCGHTLHRITHYTSNIAFRLADITTIEVQNCNILSWSGWELLRHVLKNLPSLNKVLVKVTNNAVHSGHFARSMFSFLSDAHSKKIAVHFENHEERLRTFSMQLLKEMAAAHLPDAAIYYNSDRIVDVEVKSFSCNYTCSCCREVYAAGHSALYRNKIRLCDDCLDMVTYESWNTGWKDVETMSDLIKHIAKVVVEKHNASVQAENSSTTMIIDEGQCEGHDHDDSSDDEDPRAYTYGYRGPFDYDLSSSDVSDDD